MIMKFCGFIGMANLFEMGGMYRSIVRGKKQQRVRAERRSILGSEAADIFNEDSVLSVACAGASAADHHAGQYPWLPTLLIH